MSEMLAVRSVGPMWRRFGWSANKLDAPESGSANRKKEQTRNVTREGAQRAQERALEGWFENK